MRRFVMCAVVAILVLPAMADAAGSKDGEKEAAKKLDSQGQKLSYAVGMQIGSQVKGANMEINVDAFIRGIKDSLQGEKTLLSQKEAKSIREEYVKKRKAAKARKRKKQAKKQKEKARKFLKENKKKKGVKETDSGLQYKVIKKGEGAKPTVADRVDAQVKIKTMDGKEIYNSKNADRKRALPVKGLLPGLTEGLKLMKEGGEYRFFVPPKLGIQRKGQAASPGLIIDVKLNKVVENAATKKQKAPAGTKKKK